MKIRPIDIKVKCLKKTCFPPKFSPQVLPPSLVVDIIDTWKKFPGVLMSYVIHCTS